MEQKDNNILYIDLSEHSVRCEEISWDMRKKYIGGCGINTKLLLDSEAMYHDALSEKNVLIFGVGPAVGTGLLAANRSTVTAKSPLTDLYGDSNIGGDFPINMRAIGIDHIVFTGKSKSPVYVYINKNREVQFFDADDIWGERTDVVTDILSERYGGKCEVCCIGPAAEKLVRFSSVFMSKTHVAGRMGMGCVMGSKNLKAIVIEKAKCNPTVFDKEKLKAFTKTWIKKAQTSLQFKIMSMNGTVFLVQSYNSTNNIPIENYKNNHDKRCENLYPGVFNRDFQTRKSVCKYCAMGCGKAFEIRKGPYKGESGERMEYGSIASFGSNLGIFDYGDIIHLKLLGDYLGIDTMECGGVVALVIETQQKGIIKKEDVDGRELRFGNAEDVEYLLYKIANREGIGNILAEGTYRAGKALKVEQYAFCIKKSYTGLMPRHRLAWSLGYITSTRGGDHLKDFPFTSIIEGFFQEVMGRHIFKINFKKVISVPENKGRVVWWHENYKYTLDALGFCLFCLQSVTSTGHAYFDEYAQIMQAIFNKEISKEDLFYAGERMYQLQNAFNVVSGLTIDDYKWPQRKKEDDITDELIKQTTLEVRDFPGVLPEYFEFRGLTGEGVPTKKRFIELGLEEYIERIKTSDTQDVAFMESLLKKVNLSIKLKLKEKVKGYIIYKIVSRQIDKAKAKAIAAAKAKGTEAAKENVT